MSKKKSTSGKTRPAAISPAKTPRRRFILLAGIGAAAVAVIFLLYFILPIFKKTGSAVQLTPHALAPFPKPAAFAESAAPVFEDFTGSESCAPCHREQYELWRNSTHGRAGGRPDAKNVIGIFNGKPFHYQDAEVTPGIDAQQRYTFTVKQKDVAEEVLTVAAVIGGGRLEGGGTQSYFAEFPDGTLRFLPFDFSRQKKSWFSQTRERKEWIPVHEKLSLAALNEWPPARILGSEPALSNCQNCHASQLRVRYDAQKKRFVTQYQSLDINCESCHGPGKRHIELAREDNFAAADIGMKPLATLTKDESIKICLQCHAVKDALDAAYLPGKNFERYYSLKLPLLAENPHLADGRVAAFAYQQNHLYSDCYLNGSMTCVDCHEPHAQNYRDIYGHRLAGRFNNEQCLDCHASKREGLEQHTHHRADSPGSRCTSCHLPYLQHRGIGTQIPFGRADHSIAIPRPAFDAQLGIESACQKCHAQKTVAWLEAKTHDWYGDLKPHKKVVTGLLQAEKVTDRKTAADLLLHPGALHPFAQAAGLSYFIKQFLHPDMSALDPEIVEKLKTLGAEDDVDLQALALMSLHLTMGRSRDVRKFLIEQLQSLGNRETLVRRRWALALDYLGTSYASRGEYARAIAAQQMALEIKPDDAMTMVNLGNAFGNHGDLENAVAAFQAALRADSTSVQALVNLGAAYMRRQDFAAAAQACLQAIRLHPYEPANHLQLARLYIESGQLKPALAVLQAGLVYLPAHQEMTGLRRELETMQSNSK